MSSTFDHVRDFAATPYFGTEVKIDSPETILMEPPVSLTKDAVDISKSGKKKNVRNLPGVGWQLAPYQTGAGESAERQAAQAGNMRTQADGGTLNASLYLEAHAAFRQRTDTGATYGADAATVGDHHYELAIPADKRPVDADLTSDRTSYPGPTVSSASAGLIRLVVDTVPDEPGKPLHLKISVSGPLVGSLFSLGRVYFTGPAGQETAKDPSHQLAFTGQYCFELFGDGTATLSERFVDVSGPPVGDWRTRVDHMLWCEPSRVAGSAHHIEIVCEEYTAPRAQRTGYVLIRVADSGSAAGEDSGGLLRIAGRSNPTGFLRYYANCDNPKKWKPAIHAPVRKDVRPDVAPTFQLSRPVYPAEGWFADDAVETYVFPGYSSASLRFQATGTIPGGTSIVVDVFRGGDDVETATPLTAIGRTSTSYGQVVEVTCPPQVDAHHDVVRTFVIKVTFRSADGTATPTIAHVGYVKDGLFSTYDVGEVTIQHPVLDMTGSGVDFETGRESTSIQLSDLYGQATQLSTRSQMPLRITVPYPDDGTRDVAPTSKRSILTRGYVGTAVGQKLLRTDIAQGISQNARRYAAEVSGMHQRLDEAIAPLGFDLTLDPTTLAPGMVAQPYLACDALRYMMLWCGFEPDQIGWDFGDSRYKVRLFPRSGDSLSLGAGAPLGEMAMAYARNYLGRYLDFEPNSSRRASAGDEDPTGMWEMVDPPTIPYYPLARFEQAPVAGSGSGLFLLHVPWPDWSYGGHSVPVRTFFKETKRPEAPEFDWLMVCGIGDTAGENSPVAYTTTAVNMSALNVLASNPTQDPSSVSFVGRPKRALYVDSQLGTPEAVQFVARRELDYAGTGRILRTFTAPLVLVTDPRSPYQRRKRPLRPNDCVVFRGKWCVVRSSAILARRDGFQMNRLEVQELPPDPAVTL